MAASHLIVTVEHGLIWTPKELQDNARLGDGARLQLVPVTHATPAKQRADWRGLEGILADPTVDLNGELSQDRSREFESQKVRLKGLNPGRA